MNYHVIIVLQLFFIYRFIFMYFGKFILEYGDSSK
jgi:hypothetical protein